MKHVGRRLARVALAGLFAVGTAASSAQPCLQPREAEDLVMFVLPTLTEAMARKCAPLLPVGATLPRTAPGLAARYRADSDAAWPRAKAAFMKFSGRETLTFLSDEINRQVIREASSAAIVADFKARDCAVIDRLMAAISPLPARNVAQLVALFLEAGAIDETSPLKICKAGPAR